MAYQPLGPISDHSDNRQSNASESTATLIESSSIEQLKEIQSFLSLTNTDDLNKFITALKYKDGKETLLNAIAMKLRDSDEVKEEPSPYTENIKQFVNNKSLIDNNATLVTKHVIDGEKEAMFDSNKDLYPKASQSSVLMAQEEETKEKCDVAAPDKTTESVQSTPTSYILKQMELSFPPQNTNDYDAAKDCDKANEANECDIGLDEIHEIQVGDDATSTLYGQDKIAIIANLSEQFHDQQFGNDDDDDTDLFVKAINQCIERLIKGGKITENEGSLGLKVHREKLINYIKSNNINGGNFKSIYPKKSKFALTTFNGVFSDIKSKGIKTELGRIYEELDKFDYTQLSIDDSDIEEQHSDEEKQDECDDEAVLFDKTPGGNIDNDEETKEEPISNQQQPSAHSGNHPNKDRKKRYEYVQRQLKEQQEENKENDIDADILHRKFSDSYTKGIFFFSKIMVERIGEEMKEEFVTDNENEIDLDLLFYHLRANSGMQIIDGQIKVYYDRDGKAKMILHSDLHYGNGQEMYLIAVLQTENDFIEHSVLWQIVDIKRARELSDIGIGDQDLPQSSRNMAWFQRALRSSPQNMKEYEIDEVIDRTHFTSKRLRVNDIRQELVKKCCRDTLHRYRTDLPALPIIIIKGNQHWIEWKQIVCVRNGRCIAISLRYHEKNKRWNVAKIDDDGGIVYYKHRLVALSKDDERCYTYNQLLSFLGTSLRD